MKFTESRNYNSRTVDINAIGRNGVDWIADLMNVSDLEYIQEKDAYIVKSIADLIDYVSDPENNDDSTVIINDVN